MINTVTSGDFFKSSWKRCVTYSGRTDDTPFSMAALLAGENMVSLAHLTVAGLVVLTTLCVPILASHGAKGKTKSDPGSSQKPNIVFILADDLGFHDVGYHGSKIRTPQLDKLSADGVRLENYYVQPICSPTRSQLMSGRYQIHNGIQHYLFTDVRPVGLPLDSPTLADKLRESGYATHMVGKWHLGFCKQEFMPNSRGFDTSYGSLGGHDSHYKHTRRYTDRGQFLDLREDGQPVTDKDGIHSTYLYTQRAISLIESHNKSKPMFVYLPYHAPHNPLEAPDIYEKPYEDIQDNERRAYAAMVTMLDEGVANVTQALKDNGMWDNTLLIFSTDNGGVVTYGGNNYPLRGWKSSLWEGGVRGVGFVSGGKKLKLDRGVVNKQLMHVTDWFPTLVGVAGGNLDGTKPLDGVDQWETLSTGAPTSRQWLLHNIDPMYHQTGENRFPDTFDTRVRAAIRVGDYKLITGFPGDGAWVSPPEMKVSGKPKASGQKSSEEESQKNLWLFNIAEDPEERNDLSDEEPDTVKMMLDSLAQINVTAVTPFFPPKDPLANPELLGGVWGPWQ